MRTTEAGQPLPACPVCPPPAAQPNNAQDNNLDRAVELFASVLETRIKHYGGKSA